MYLFIIYFKLYLTSCNQNIVHFLIENTVYSKIFTPIYFDPFVLVSVCEFKLGEYQFLNRAMSERILEIKNGEKTRNTVNKYIKSNIHF